MYSRAEGIADHYWPWAVFFLLLLVRFLLPLISIFVRDGIVSIAETPTIIQQ